MFEVPSAKRVLLRPVRGAVLWRWRGSRFRRSRGDLFELGQLAPGPPKPAPRSPTTGRMSGNHPRSTSGRSTPDWGALGAQVVVLEFRPGAPVDKLQVGDRRRCRWIDGRSLLCNREQPCDGVAASRPHALNPCGWRTSRGASGAHTTVPRRLRQGRAPTLRRPCARLIDRLPLRVVVAGASGRLCRTTNPSPPAADQSSLTAARG